MAFAPSTPATTGNGVMGAISATAPTTPNTSPFATSKSAVKLAPGQTLHFQPGKGYFAAAPATPAAQAPAPAQTGLPVSTPQQVNQDAAQTASQEVTASESPLYQQQQTQDATALATEQQAAAVNQAGSQLMGSIGPQAQAGYGTAAQEVGQLAQGFDKPMQATLQDEQAQGASQAAALGATGENAPAQVDTAALGNATYMGNGYIPASNLAEQGAAANQWGQGLKAVNTDAGRAEQQGLIASGQAADAKVSDQIATLAAKYPTLFTAQEHADIAQNATNFRDNTTATNDATRNDITSQNDAANQTLKAGALKVSAISAATRSRVASNQAIYENNEIKIRNGTLHFDEVKSNETLKLQVDKLNQAQTKLVQQGNGVDASASKVAGTLVLKNGTITNIPVNPKVYSSSSVIHQTPAQKLVQTAAKALGTPVKTPSAYTATGSGVYLLDPALKPTGKSDIPGGAKFGHNLPATTNDPARAEKSATMTFAQAQAQYMGQYGLSRAQTRKAMIAAGWTPDGKGKPTNVIPFKGAFG